MTSRAMPDPNCAGNQLGRGRRCRSGPCIDASCTDAASECRGLKPLQVDVGDPQDAGSIVGPDMADSTSGRPQDAVRSRGTAPTIVSKSTGFAKCALNPASNASCLSRSEEYPVTAAR